MGDKRGPSVGTCWRVGYVLGRAAWRRCANIFLSRFFLLSHQSARMQLARAGTGEGISNRYRVIAMKAPRGASWQYRKSIRNQLDSLVSALGWRGGNQKN